MTAQLSKEDVLEKFVDVIVNEIDYDIYKESYMLDDIDFEDEDNFNYVLEAREVMKHLLELFAEEYTSAST